MSLADLKEVSSNIKTQDNLATSNPFYTIYELTSVPVDNADNFTRFKIADGWLDDEGNFIENYGSNAKDYEALTTLARGAEQSVIDGICCENKYVLKIPVFVTACFTRAGADAYLKANGHNLTQPYIHVHSLTRNAEMIGVREFITTNF